MAMAKLEDFNEEHFEKLRKISLRKLMSVERSFNKISDNPENHYEARETFMETFDVLHLKMITLLDLNSEVEKQKEKEVKSEVVNAPKTFNFQLSPIQIPNFCGNISGFVSFRDTFKALVVDNKSLSDIEKWHYLKNALRGEPADLISSLFVTNETFQIAWNSLLRRYENSRVILSYHVNNLFKLPVIKKGTSQEYRAVVNQLLCHQRASESLLKDQSLGEVLLMELFLKSLTPADRLTWESQVSDTNCNLDSLVAFFETKARSLEIYDASCNSPHEIYSKSFSLNVDICVMCEENDHNLESCPEFKKLSLREKRDFLKGKVLCFCCLKSNHSFKNCEEVCSICQNSHHELLHQ